MFNNDVILNFLPGVPVKDFVKIGQ